MHPHFVASLIQTLDRRTNLKSFTCTPRDALPSLLTTFHNLKSLEKIRLNAHLTADQGKFLLTMNNLKSIALDGASWNVVDLLPQWTLTLKTSLTCLTLSVRH